MESIEKRHYLCVILASVFVTTILFFWQQNFKFRPLLRAEKQMNAHTQQIYNHQTTQTPISDKQTTQTPVISEKQTIQTPVISEKQTTQTPVISEKQTTQTPVISEKQVSKIGLSNNSTVNLELYIRPGNVTALILQVCASGEDFPLVVVVCSAVPHFEARLAIRETWGSVVRDSVNNRSSSVRIVFLLGRSENSSWQAAVQNESRTFGDIIQEDFIDTYNNLTVKSVMLLKWVESFCERAQFVMKTDDDMFVNIPNILALLHKEKGPNFLIGYRFRGAVPVQDKNSKFYTPATMFNESVYPAYVSGTGYIMSRDLVSPLYKAALQIPFLFLEDIFITGLCARQLKIKPHHHSGFNYRKIQFSVCLYRQIFTSHRMTPEDFHRVWEGMNNTTINCTLT